jgi:hypothetical protein
MSSDARRRMGNRIFKIMMVKVDGGDGSECASKTDGRGCGVAWRGEMKKTSAFSSHHCQKK